VPRVRGRLAAVHRRYRSPQRERHSVVVSKLPPGSASPVALMVPETKPIDHIREKHRIALLGPCRPSRGVAHPQDNHRVAGDAIPDDVGADGDKLAQRRAAHRSPAVRKILQTIPGRKQRFSEIAAARKLKSIR